MTEMLGDWLDKVVTDGSSAIAVCIVNALGSTPRDEDALMIVSREAVRGTIGGGALEWTAIEHARDMLERRETSATLAIPLGPFIGQCCGGHVTLRFLEANRTFLDELREFESSSLAQRDEVIIFGAGHVGRAIGRAFAPLPYRTRILDTRPEEIAHLPQDVRGEVSSDLAEEVRLAAPNTAFLILTHSHTMDFLVAEAALQRPDAAYVGLIGSKTKRERFRSWFKARNGTAAAFARLVCPIGSSRVRDKRPEIIAALVAAEVVTEFHLKAAKDVHLTSRRNRQGELAHVCARARAESFRKI
jgi:xanthine dehydrogenase accessory protein XdhC